MIAFESKPELEKRLCQDIAQYLIQAIEEKGTATLLLSGGSTPGGVYRLLAETDLDWSQVYVGLVDERFVGPEDEYSNHLLLRNSLLQHKAQNAVFVPMVSMLQDYLKNEQEMEKAYRIFTEPDVVLLGMGPDGHTASIFPNDPASQQALIEQTSQIIFNTNAPAHPTQRITCSKTLLCNAKHLLLMLTGEQKLTIFSNAEQMKLPIAAFKNHIQETYYTAS
ncbi:MAG: 6-phosphogluconolactonase [Flavobacteriales bacterium]